MTSSPNSAPASSSCARGKHSTDAALTTFIVRNAGVTSAQEIQVILIAISTSTFTVPPRAAKGDRMRATIHWVKDGIEDSMNIEASTLEELQKIAKQEVEKRGADDYWSSDFEEDFV